MANIKNFTTGNQYIDGYIEAWETDVNISNNTSTAHAAVYMHRNNSWNGNSYTSNFYRKLTINGSTVYEVENGTTIPPKASGYVKVAEGSIPIQHDADGKKTVTITFAGEDRVSSSLSAFDISLQSGTLTLSNIPRQATLLSAPNFNDEQSPTITYSNPAGNAVNSLKVCIANNDMNYTYANWRDVSKTDTSYTFNLTEAERNALRDATKNSNTMTIAFMIETVINGVYYYNSIHKTLTIVNSSPTLNPIVKDIGNGSLSLTGDENKIIKGFNHVEFASNATTLKSATITSQRVVCGGNYSSNGNGSFIDVDSASFVFTVTDSRGNTTSKTINKTLIDYVKLSNNIKNKKPDVSGKVIVECDGNYFNGSFGAVDNTLSVQYRYKEQYGEYGDWVDMTATISGNTYAAEAELTGLDYRKTYIFQTKATDTIFWEGILSQEIAVRSHPVFDWGEEDFNVNGTLKINNKSIFDLIYPIGAIYMSLDNTNPTYLFGGEWENIQGRFLIAAGTSTDDANITKTFNVGQTGGEYDHQLTIQEMPSHHHTQTAYSIPEGQYSASSANMIYKDNTTTSWVAENLKWMNDTGGDWTHNNTPPYLAVYMWKRIA